VDTEGFQTPYRLAAAMDLPIVNEVNKMHLVEGKAIVGREIGGGARQSLEISLPCVLGVTKGLNDPRYPKFPDIMKAKKKPLKELTLVDLDIQTDAALSELVGLEKVPERSGARILDGDVRQAVNTLVKILKEDEKVI
jgi:electron transfer flavoprotein beta subunit